MTPKSLGQIGQPNSTIIVEICRHYLYTCIGNMPSSPRSQRTLEMRRPYVWDGRTRTALPGMWCKARGPTWQWPWRIQWSDSQTGVHWWCYRYPQGSPLCHWCPLFGCCYRRSQCPRGRCQRRLNWRCRQWRRSPTRQHCLGYLPGDYPPDWMWLCLGCAHLKETDKDISSSLNNSLFKIIKSFFFFFTWECRIKKQYDMCNIAISSFIMNIWIEQE